MGPVARAIAAVAGVDTSAIEMSVNMRDAFGFDSRMWVEPRAPSRALDRRPSIRRSSVAARRFRMWCVSSAPPVLEDASVQADEPVKIPAPLASAMKRGMGMLQQTLNGAILNTRVTGQANIPANRSTIVVSNHTSPWTWAW